MRLNRSTATLFSIALVCFGATCPATAQITPGDGLIIFNGGYTTGKSAQTEQTISGGMISFTYEKLSFDKPLSFGMTLGYGNAHADSGSGAEKIERTINTIPFYLGGKYYLGKNKVQAYLGLALGLYFSWMTSQNVESEESWDSAGISGAGLGVPIGATLSLGETLFINANYTLNWLWSNDYFESDILHAFNLGLGFKVGK